MWQIVKVHLLGFCFSSVLFGVSASAAMLKFTPHVMIEKDHSSGGGVVIDAKKTDFTAIYSSAINTFRPLDIPFTVRTEDSAPHTYVIKVKDSQHWCNSYMENDKELPGVAVEIGVLDMLQPGAAVTVNNSTESTHSIRVSFPEILVTSEEKTCYGTLILLAEIPS